jgi:hypothetical protein
MSYFKYNIYLNEIVSILITGYILGFLLYYSLISRFFTGMELKNYLLVEASFNFEVKSEIFSDASIILSSLAFKNINSTESYSFLETSNRGLLLLNKLYFQNKSAEQIKEYFNSHDLTKECFIFNDNKSISRALKLVNQMLTYNSDFWNVVVFSLISLFFFFIKFNMTNDCISIVKESENKLNLRSPKFIYYYIVFNLSTLFILPLFYKTYNDIKTNECLGFSSNYFNSYFHDRSFISKSQEKSYDLYAKTYQNFTAEKRNMFFIHKPNMLSSDVVSYSYVYNILFMCVMVWMSNIFYNSIFAKKSSSLRLDSDEKSLVKILTTTFLFFIWVVFLIYGFIVFIDITSLYHRYVYYNFRKILDPSIFSFIFVTYWNIYFYIYLIWVNLVYRQKKQRLLILKPDRDRIGDFDNNLVNTIENSPQTKLCNRLNTLNTSNISSSAGINSVDFDLKCNMRNSQI